MEISIVSIIVLIIAMVLDYISGIIKSYETNTLSSKVGAKGIIKKFSYFLVIVISFIIDFILCNYTLNEINIYYPIISEIIIAWFVINEVISILENVSEIGVPLPKFIINITSHLKNNLDNININKGDKHEEIIQRH